jgi:hypothetical protein
MGPLDIVRESQTRTGIAREMGAFRGFLSRLSVFHRTRELGEGAFGVCDAVAAVREAPG